MNSTAYEDYGQRIYAAIRHRCSANWRRSSSSGRGERGLRLTVVPPPGPPRVVGDATKLRQVLFNLLGNALKFTPAGAVTLGVVAEGTGHQTRFSVIDTGIGIAPQDQTRIFEPFTQTETGERVQGGTGLGLALSRQYVQLMGGTLTLESTPGQGSHFTFALSLPAAAPSGAESAKRPEVHGLAPDQPPCRVLIVDDLAANRAPLRRFLEGLNPPRPSSSRSVPASSRATGPGCWPAAATPSSASPSRRRICMPSLNGMQGCD